MGPRLVAHFLRARACVEQTHAGEVAWARGLSLARLDAPTFLAEVLFVALNSGMRAAVVAAKWPRVRACFGEFRDVDLIAAQGEVMVRLAAAGFNAPGKLRAVVVAAQRVVAAGGWPAFHARLQADPAAAIAGLPYVGAITRWHLLRNLGAEVAKPDRHLVRLAAAHGWGTDVQGMCRALGAEFEERVGVVDLVLWRHAERGCACADETPQGDGR